MADRHGPLRVPLGRWIEAGNDGQISAGAILAQGSAVGVDELPFPGDPEVGVMPGDNVTFVVPAGARRPDSERIDTKDILVVVPGRAVETGDRGATAPANTFETDAESFFPGGRLLVKIEMKKPGDDDVRAWFPGGGDAVEALVAAETSVVLFGSEESGPGSFGEETDAFEPIEEGTALETANTVFVMPGDRVIPDESLPKADLFDAGVAAPLSGATFTMSVLSTPDASVLGQSANPLVGLDTDALLEREETQRLLDRAGVTDADSVEWLAGPTRIEGGGGGGGRISLLGEASDIESFAAVISGAAGPWLLFAHVVRVTTEDHVVVLGLHRRAIGTPEGAGDLAALGETESVQYGRELVRQAAERLEGS
jgi:hypothetical protein